MTEVQRWDTWELSLKSRTTYDNPFRDIAVRATFTHEKSGRTIEVDGFYDGGRTWRVRFCPVEKGTWSFRTASEDDRLNGAEGWLKCVAPRLPHLHGPIRCQGHAFAHADGTRRFVISTRLSCHLGPPRVWRRAIGYLSKHGVNRILFMMGGIHGTIHRLFGEGKDLDRYNVPWFQAIDRFINELRKADVLASPYFYYFNDKDQRLMTPEQDRAYVRYGMARFGAYANVMPVLSNEVDQKFTDRGGQYDLRSHAWANEMGAVMKERAVFGVPVAVHNPQETEVAVNPGFYTLLYDWPFPWSDFMLRQAQVAALSTAPEISDQIPEQKTAAYNFRGYARHNQLLIDLRRFGIPVVNEEPGYEMEGHQAFPDRRDLNFRPWNSQTRDTLVPTFWSAAAAGGYVMWGNYATYWLDDPLPGIRRTPTPRHLKVLSDVMGSLPYDEMTPSNELVSAGEKKMGSEAFRTNFCLAKPGTAYLVFTLDGGELEVKLQGGPYRVEQVDPRSGVKRKLGKAAGGTWKATVEGVEQVVVLRKGK